MKEQETIAWMADLYEERFMKLSSCFFKKQVWRQVLLKFQVLGL
jgi:hypothetical protein